ncbi:MAG: PCMD domain-containing protein [Muribaculaceae bacterium]|nr:PCMD domain-containing protein [Muribaculaceae bacterium]
MKFFHWAIIGIAAITEISCIRQDPLNAECDILEVSLPGNVLNRQPLIENDKVTLIVKNDVSLMNLAPAFKLTPGATIEPASGTSRSFLVPQVYTVTSEDRKWSKKYLVTVEKNNTISLNYNFDHVRIVNALGGASSYDVFYEIGPTGNETLEWASANKAFALTFQGSMPNTFPTYQGDDGVDGHCAVLVTRSTGSYGQRLGKPIASGNLFLGTFDMTEAISKPLEATHFGVPFNNIPSQFSGYYKYAPGETYCEPGADGKLVPVPGKTDSFSLYSVFFETEPGHEWLDGTNVLAADNPYIISTAEISDPQASEEWVEFSVPFVLRSGKSIDIQKLKDGKYSIAIVMGSSSDGERFCGAIGSTLKVDELSITCVADSEEN